MKTGTIIIIALTLLVVVVAFFVFKGSAKSKAAQGAIGGNGYNPAGNNTGNTSSGNGGATPPPTPPATPVGPKTLENLIGQPVVAKYNGTKVYYGTSGLQVAKTYNAGEFIGYLGQEDVGNFICSNHPGYYRVIGTGLIQTFGIIDQDVDGGLGCGAIMSKYWLNQIFDIS